MVAIESGLWWDHSKPAAYAATLTLSTSSSNYLLSALALLITLAGASAWNITSFVLHAIKTRDEAQPTHGVHLMHQVLLRNSGGAVSTLWHAVKIHLAWSKQKPPHLLKRTSTVAAPAFLVWAGFALAAVFASNVANKSYGSTIARIAEDNCGLWVYDNTTIDGQVAALTKRVNDTLQARSYVSNFYANTSKSSSARSSFVQAALPYDVSAAAPCPIPASQRCLLGANAAYRMYTPLLDSHVMLGVNARPKDRVSIQINATCSPVSTKAYNDVVVAGNDTFVEYYMGRTNGGQINTTYRYNMFARYSGIGYLIYPVGALAGSTVSPQQTPWAPIADFSPPDADVSVFFLSQNGIVYISPVHDPWFSATGIGLTYPTPSGPTYLGADYPVNALACTQQYIMCNPSTDACTSANGWNSLQRVLLPGNPLGFNTEQFITASRLISSLENAAMFNVVEDIGVSALWANSKVFQGGQSPGLPPNQWQIEVLGWFQTVLAQLQTFMVDFASNDDGLSPYASAGPIVTNRSTEYGRDLARHQCQNQLVQTVGESQNFSFLGLMIILCFSFLLILLDLLLETVVNLVAKLRKRPSSLKAARQADHILHLLRMALGDSSNGFEARWTVGRFDVPIAAEPAQFSRLGLSKDLASYTTQPEMVTNQVASSKRE